MARKIINRVKLGVFVLAGLGFLILLLYIIGKNQNMFGSTFILKARFDNVHGLMPGNNIRFAGIDAGTVRSIKVLNDTTIEVSMLVKNKMKGYIRKNATVSISTDGLMGNRLLNIEAAKRPAALVDEGDILLTTQGPDTDEMLNVLNSTSNDIAFIARELKQTIVRINNSAALWEILEDGSLPQNIRTSLDRIREASAYLRHTMAQLDALATDLKTGKGSIGQLLADTLMAEDIKLAVRKFRDVGNSADSLSDRITSLVSDLQQQVSQGKGTVSSLLNNEELKKHMEASVVHIEDGARAFKENMEAVQHSFLFRGYFRRMEKQKKKDTLRQLNY